MIQDNNWYPYSRATHHLTPDLNNLLTKSQFPSSDEVFMGNGKGLPIHHHSFPPKHLPYHVFFGVHPTFCFVKDLSTQTVLMHG